MNRGSTAAGARRDTRWLRCPARLAEAGRRPVALTLRAGAALTVFAVFSPWRTSVRAEFLPAGKKNAVRGDTVELTTDAALVP